MLPSVPRPTVRLAGLRGPAGVGCGCRLQRSSTWCFPFDHGKGNAHAKLRPLQVFEIEGRYEHRTLHCQNCRSQSQQPGTIVLSNWVQRSYEILEVTSRRTSLVGGKCMWDLMLSASHAPGKRRDVIVFDGLAECSA